MYEGSHTINPWVLSNAEEAMSYKGMGRQKGVILILIFVTLVGLSFTFYVVMPVALIIKTTYTIAITQSPVQLRMHG